MFQIRIPPLRERLEDIPLLAQQLVSILTLEFRSSKIALRLMPKLSQRLTQYTWPGNIRELRNLLERVIIPSQGRSLSHKYLGFPGEDDRPSALASASGIKGYDDIIQDTKRSLIEDALKRGRRQETRGCALTRSDSRCIEKTDDDAWFFGSKRLISVS